MTFKQRIKRAATAFSGGGVKGVVWPGQHIVGDYGQIGLPLDHGNNLIINGGFSVGQLDGDAWDSSAVFPCLRFLGNGLGSSPVHLTKPNAKGKPEPVNDPRSGLLARPCPEYDGVAFLKAMALSYALDGNAYAILSRGDLLQPKEVLYVPHTQMKPVADKETGRLSHYVRFIQSRWQRVEITEVIHVRDGIDPHNALRGISAWTAIATEVFTDRYAALASELIMKRCGVVPFAISFKQTEGDEPMTQEELDLAKAKLEDSTGLANSGRPTVFSRLATILKLGSTPEELVLDKVRKIPTERVCACFGLSPMVVHLPSDNMTFSNYAEARESATETTILPMQRSFEAAFDHALLTNYDRARRYGWRFDNSNVRELQEDVDALHDRVRADFLGGLITREQANERLGYDTVTSGTFYGVADTVGVPKSVQMLAMKRESEALRSH